MSWLNQLLAPALTKQSARDAQRARIQTLGQAVMEDDLSLDSPQALAANPTLAAILGEGRGQASTGMDQVMQNPMQVLQTFLSGVSPGTPLAGNLPVAMGGLMPELASLFGQQGQGQALPTAPVGMDNNAQAIAGALGESEMPQATPAAAPEASGLASIFKDPKLMELLLQTGIGLAQGADFGTALSAGVQGMRQLDINAAGVKAQERKAVREDRLAEAEVTERLAKARNLEAESKKIAKEMAAGNKDGKLTSNQYATGLADMYKHVTSDIFTIADIKQGKSFNDAETISRYLWNSSIPADQRVYSPLKDNYINNMGQLVQDVQAGNVTPAELNSRVDEYVVAFGPEATAKMLKQLQGTTQ